VLGTIPVAKEISAGYSASLFGYPIELRGNGCDTRAEVLIAETLAVIGPTPGNCVLGVGGQWYSAYDGVTTTNKADLEIDHVVALKEAWDSGAYTWAAAKLQAYGNDLSDERSLRAVTVAVDQAKGDEDPSDWLPPLVSDSAATSVTGSPSRPDGSCR
jgi:hypothetical protein